MDATQKEVEAWPDSLKQLRAINSKNEPSMPPVVIQAKRIDKLRKALETALAIIANDAAGPLYDANPEGRAKRLRWVAELEAEAGIEPIAQEQASDGEGK